MLHVCRQNNFCLYRAALTVHLCHALSNSFLREPFCCVREAPLCFQQDFPCLKQKHKPHSLCFSILCIAVLGIHRTPHCFAPPVITKNKLSLFCRIHPKATFSLLSLHIFPHTQVCYTI